MGRVTLLMVRLGGFVTLAFLVFSPGKAVAFMAVELAVSASTWARRLRRTTSACRWSLQDSSWTSCAARS